MPSQLSRADWDLLLARLDAGACTPFLGPGVHDGRTPLPGDIAAQWAETGGYPLEDRWNLARVAQFMAIERGPRWPQDELASALAETRATPEGESAETLVSLADLPFRTYVTTAADDRLVRALRSRTCERAGKQVSRRPRADFCRWQEALRSAALATPFDEDPRYVPSVEEPFVFHLHGQVAVRQSLVVTEDDHIDLLLATARYPNLIPPAVQRALRGGPLLLLGQPLAEWGFRALLRSLCGPDFGGLQAGSVAVQAAPPGAGEEVLGYVEKLFGKLRIAVYWGTPQEFLQELRERRDGTHSGEQ
ncbi:MAG TPA: SIR2 family protein [Nannocystis sp.]|jgi:hypothetical protein